MSTDNRRRSIRVVFRGALFVACGVLLSAGLLLMIVPTLDGPHHRRLANEAAAVSKFHTIFALQAEYMAAHAGNGFACDLSLLRPFGQGKFPDYSLDFLTAKVQSGYRFSMASCSSDANRARVHYQITAVPVARDTTGIRAFCADETEVIWYDADGSATNCLASRRPLE